MRAYSVIVIDFRSNECFLSSGLFSSKSCADAALGNCKIRDVHPQKIF